LATIQFLLSVVNQAQSTYAGTLGSSTNREDKRDVHPFTDAIFPRSKTTAWDN